MEKTPYKLLELPEPWYWTDENLSKQLEIELHDNHILKGRSTKTIARRQDNDDVLFEIENGEYAVVHITWQKSAHKNILFPTTEIYLNWQDIFENKILPDATEFY
jgi:hypothetical protein